MHFIPAAEAADALHPLLTVYYREGEDADTPAEVLDEFIGYLQALLAEGKLWGSVAFEGDEAAGFVLYAFDGEGYPFSECPGMGTIAEICVSPAYRQRGLGRELVRHAENALRGAASHMYVCAHASAQAFWERCGYQPTGRLAANGLPLCTKAI